jgi:hypothetical protein
MSFTHPSLCFAKRFLSLRVTFLAIAVTCKHHTPARDHARRAGGARKRIRYKSRCQGVRRRQGRSRFDIQPNLRAAVHPNAEI